MNPTRSVGYVTEYCARHPQALPSRAIPLREAAACHAASTTEYHGIINFIPPGLVGIDAAAGMGIGTGLLARISRRVIGLEMSPERLAEAGKINAGKTNIIWFQRDLNAVGPDTPLFSQAVDYVVSLQTIEHLFNPRAFLTAIHSTLKNRGVLVLSAPTVQTTDMNPYHLQDFTPGALSELVRSAGFEITGLVSTRSVHPLAWGNPLKKEGRIIPNIIPKSLLLKNMAEVYWRDPRKLLYRLASLAQDRGFPHESTRIVAEKI